MKTIPQQFTKKGWSFEQGFREGPVAVFRRTRLPNGTQEHYETVRLLPYKARHAFGKDREAGESYPSSEQWGTYGFTLPDKTAAMAKARELITRLK